MAAESEKKTETEAKKSAKAAGLRYVLDSKTPGFTRLKHGKGFSYRDKDGKKVTSNEDLSRFAALVIPPAWQQVWISPFPNSHLQATGYDAKGRKVYIYHPDWRKARSKSKFLKVTGFAEGLKAVRSQMEKDLRRRTLGKEKVVALVLSIMEHTSIRVGNREYAKTNKSFGLTTLRDRHAEIHGAEVKFEFVGKKGVPQQVSLSNRRLAKLIKSCRDIPGQHLFQYLDAEGTRHQIESGDVNEYLHRLAGPEFSAKDFRTWSGTLEAFRLLRECPPASTTTERKKIENLVLKEVAAALGNTPSVCRKYYVHPALLEAYADGTLESYFAQCRDCRTDEQEREYLEELLLGFLAKS